MAISFSRPDPSSPSAVSSASFSPSRKGFDQIEVREFLRMVAAELARLQEREKFLERELRTAQTGSPSPAALDDEVITRALGEEAARILHTAREAASQIRIRSEESASRMLRDASDEAQRLRQETEIEISRRRQDATVDNEAEVQMAKQQGREMVNEARAYRERVLADVARRRELARQQIEQLVHGRDRLIQAFDRARIAAEDVIVGMAPMPDQDEFVNLAPTTGPVPLMVPVDELPVTSVRVVEEALDSVEVVGFVAEEVEVLDIPLDDEADADAVVAVAEPTAEVTVTAVTVPADDVPADDVPADDLCADDVPGAEVALEADTEGHDEHIAPVVSLFGDDDRGTATVDHEPTAAGASDGLGVTVDNLFARLRAARADTVAERVAAAEPVVEVSTIAPAPAPAPEPTPAPVTAVAEVVTPAADASDSPFVVRDAALTPLIVAAARKLKRVLADEQNDILHAAKTTKKKVSADGILLPEAEHLERWTSAIQSELLAAASAGAVSVRTMTEKELATFAPKKGTLDPARAWLADAVVRPLRDRLEVAVADSDGDATDLADSVRAIYREWKNQRIDEHLDDVVRMAFGRGALAAVKAGTPLCWVVDPSGPACADAEDNSLAGSVPAGQQYPTDHVCAPAHAGCRCMLQQAPR